MEITAEHGQGTARAHRHRHDGVQEGPRRGRRRRREGHRDPAEEGLRPGQGQGRTGRLRRGRSGPTSTPTARSASWSRSTARPTSSPRNEEFKDLVKNIAMHIAASAPLYIAPEDIPADVPREGKGHHPRAVQGLQEARGDRREDRPGQAGQVLRGGLPPRTAVHQGRQDEGQGPDRPVHRQVQGEHQGRPVRPLPDRSK